MNVIFDRIIPGYDHYKLYIYNTDNYPVPNKYILYKEKPEYAGFRGYDGYSYEDYIIDKTDYQNVSNKPLVYNIKYYHHIEPDGTYVYEKEWFQEDFSMTFSCHNTKYDYTSFEYTHSENFSFVYIRMYPIWGIYISPFHPIDEGKFKRLVQKEPFGPMTDSIDNRTEDSEILYLTVHSPNNEEVFKFKVIKYAKNSCLNLPIAGADKTKMIIKFDNNAQHKTFSMGYYCTDDINDLIIENDSNWVTYSFAKKESNVTKGNNYNMTITVPENNTEQTRVCNLILRTPDRTRTEKIEITQLYYVPLYAYIDGLSVSSNNYTSSARLTKITWNQHTFTVQLQTNTTVIIRKTTQLAMYTWPEFINEEDYPIEVTGDGTRQNITFNVSSVNDTDEARQGHIEFAMYDPIANKTYKFDKVIRQLAKENEDVQNS